MRERAFPLEKGGGYGVYLPTVMYKGLIIFVTLLLIGGAGYYFKNAGATDLVAQGISQGAKGKSFGVSALSVFSGYYECKKGCEYTTRLILEEDTTLDFSATINGQDVSLGQGTWGIGKDGAIVFILQKTDPELGGYPRSLTAKKISSMQITGFSNQKNLFKGMEDPLFIRSSEKTDESTSSSGASVENDLSEEAQVNIGNESEAPLE